MLRKYIESKNGISHKDTLKRVIAILDHNLLNLIFYKWLEEAVNVKIKRHAKINIIIVILKKIIVRLKKENIF